ncbi:universal stress protein [Salinadaptatus halalkaliphilus]|uniref:Universal stress protein n=1 Tax=Salinadaptatus halalkaliphilus TaxID=2419781 RepID=A0A4S3TQK9_9EURY|nr:universal stress protein [Salinadaptatus halalkaliphilus]THE66576.1 universal stress protein [Salinadaptatus halalkaliphilus]
MYTVVMPVKSDRSLDTAAYVAGLPDSETDVEVIVLNVFEEFEVTDETGVVRSKDLYEDATVPNSVTEVAEYLEDHDVDVTVRREHGDPVEEILRVSNEADADTIAIAGRRRSPTGKAIFGSVAQRVLLESDRPVTVMTSD